MAILVTGGAGYIGSHTVVAVSYTHLDVYKRQTLILPNILSGIVLGFVWKFKMCIRDS